MNRVRFLSKIVLAASVVFALALTFSCSDSDSGPTYSEPTYFYSAYGIKNCSAVSTIISDLPTNPSFEDIRTTWSQIRQYGDFLESQGGMSEAEARQLLLERDMSPKEIDEFVNDIKRRNNSLAAYQPKPGSAASYLPYCILMAYAERE